MDRKQDSPAPFYRETQYFRQLWMWALVLFISLLSFYGAFQQLILREPFGNNPAPDSMMVVLAIIFGIGLPLFMYMMNLTIEIRSDGLYFRFFPFHLSFHRIATEEIKGFEACTYSPSRYPRAEPVALVKKQALLDALRASSHSPTGKARGTLPFGLLEVSYIRHY